ncbi:coenzyme F420-0:L-glutamate ligase [Motiliproteus sp. MSK22-1]|uniref:coenzyme F420-0:L-glutamate ligase n=1 Tax=Motiliproteus sp. MSK22-1 TaxID=1897630 RepID=UPI0009F97AE8|nr:coenzyme F420-0:L-glutamate ligase [Motiliproteus sp. MSK22-1]
MTAQLNQATELSRRDSLREPVPLSERTGVSYGAASNGVNIQAVPGLPDIKPGDDLVALIMGAMAESEMSFDDGDILVIAHKVVSKSEGRIVRLADVEPSDEALELAETVTKDPRKIETILSESKRIVRAVKRPGQDEGILIAEHRLGFICANAAVDESNVDLPGHVILLPENPDASAQALCKRLEQMSGKQLGVVITDTFGRPWRMGLVNVAIGLANVPGKVDLAGENDAYGRELKVTIPALADELAAASGLLMSKEGKKPALIFKGVEWSPACSSALDLIRPQQEDLFR